MKKIAFALGLTVLFCSLLSIPNTFADGDPLVVGPNIYKLVFENDQVRVLDVHFKVGDKIAEHSHPNHFVYVLEAGTIKISHPDGTSQTIEGKVGDVVWVNAETHSAENIGTTAFHALVVELKKNPA